LRNVIDRAWLSSKVITLVAFDLKGAFNGASGPFLDLQFMAKGIPTMLRTWVVRFMDGRSASISFDDFESARFPLENVGLAQGSPLSLDHRGGASAFIDDYFRWRAGKSAEENLKKLQGEDIPRIERWAKTGSYLARRCTTELMEL
jgi:hypothetical protein